MRKYIYIFVIIFFVILVSCTKNDDFITDDGGNNNIIEDISKEEKFYKVSYIVTYNEEDILVYEYLCSNQTPVLNLEYLRFNVTSIHSYLGNFEWVDEGVAIDENYYIEKDTELKGNILTLYSFNNQYPKLIDSIVYTKLDTVIVPEIYYSVHSKRNYIVNDQTNKYEFVDESSGLMICNTMFNDFRYYSEMGYEFYPNQSSIGGGIIPSEKDINCFLNTPTIDNETKIIENLIIPATCYVYGIPSLGFYCQFVRNITILGDVPIISENSFRKANYLESLTIDGNVGIIESKAFSMIEDNDINFNLNILGNYESQNQEFLDYTPNISVNITGKTYQPDQINTDVYNVKYFIGDQLFYECNVKKGESIPILRYTNDHLNIVNDGVNIIEVEWFINDCQVDKDFTPKDDVVLTGEIVSIIECVQKYYMSKVVYSKNKSIHVPSIIQAVEFYNGHMVLKEKKCTLYGWGYNQLFLSYGLTSNDNFESSFISNIEIDDIYIDGFICRSLGSYLKLDNNQYVKKIVLQNTFIQYSISNLDNLETLEVYAGFLYMTKDFPNLNNHIHLYVDYINKY